MVRGLFAQMIFPAARDTAGTTPRRLNSRTASLAQRNWPVRLTPITVFHCSRVMFSKGASRCKPALLTRMSTVPSCSTALRNRSFTSTSRETSARIASARLPPCAMSFTTATAASSPSR